MVARALPLCLVALACAAPVVHAKGPAKGTTTTRTSAVAPLVLPGSASAASVRQTGRTWIVGGAPGTATRRLAARFGARSVIAGAGIYVVAKRDARAFAGALQRAGRLTMAEPDALARKAAMPSDPLTPQQWWLPAVVDPQLTPPPVTPSSPVLGVIEEQIDLSHPDMQGIVSTSTGAPPDEHGTAVAGAAGAPANGVGIVGIWPGMRILLPVYRGVSCSNITAAVYRAIVRRVSVINMSYGFDVGECFTHLVATQRAFARGIVLVAAGGNEFNEGNPLSRPATDPHVVTVAALKSDFTSADFSNENGGIDVSAPGAGVLLPVPPQFDTSDGARDGYSSIDGTSFASPIVAGAATWLRAVRPELSAGQVGTVLQESADDLGARGWDQRFGYGKVNLRDALANRVPPADPLEPNDDVEWVNGKRFGGPHAPIFGRNDRVKSVTATLDRFEDPADVYRVILPPRSTVRFRMTVQWGDPDLDVYSGGIRTINRDTGLLGRSVRNGRLPDTVTVVNRSRSARTVYANSYVLEGSPLDSGYRLEVRRIR
jgi:subtilisin family serine protease